MKSPARQLTDHEGVHQHFVFLERTYEANIGMAEVMDPYRCIDDNHRPVGRLRLTENESHSRER